MRPGDNVSIIINTGRIVPYGIWHGIVRDGGACGLCIEWEYDGQTVSTQDWAPEIWKHIQATP